MHLGYHVLGRLLKAELEAAGVSMSEALVIRLVTLNSNVTIGALVRTTGLAPATVTSIVARLEREMLVRCSRDGRDRRFVVVRPRPVGRTVAGIVEAAIEDVERKLLQHTARNALAGLSEVTRALDLVERPERPSSLG